MKLRTFLYVLGAMGAAYAMITLFVANRAVLMEHTFHFWGGIDLPVGLTLILFLVAGVTITLLAGLTREASKMMEGWRLREASKTREEIEEEYGTRARQPPLQHAVEAWRGHALARALRRGHRIPP